MIADVAALAAALQDAYGPKCHAVVTPRTDAVLDVLERVFGLPIRGQKVKQVDISFVVGEPVTATVERFVGIDEGNIRTEWTAYEVGKP